ncbi:hypothetical protein Mnod_7172 [Methylobacterium nodulans ORS 2060]|uniref:Uncharacterized protein n=1 Tax=Methylobacterium nodulans (strain LMG 21967 / CNCM I-2342 / ORS 2060) TaxID=460265 RepID=B8IKC7_METNO|nr:hypothetical protein Mnod_7172 [Methylobacterium nodulans ORS 2060]
MLAIRHWAAYIVPQGPARNAPAAHQITWAALCSKSTGKSIWCGEPALVHKSEPPC